MNNNTRFSINFYIFSILVFGAIVLILLVYGLNRFYSNISPLNIPLLINENPHCNLNVSYELNNKKVNIKIQTDEIVESWQPEYFYKGNYEVKLVFGDNNILTHDKIRISTGTPLSIDFSMLGTSIEDFVLIKEFFIAKKNNNSNLDLILPLGLDFNAKIRNIAKNDFLRQKELKLLEEQALRDMSELAYRYDENKNLIPFTAINLRKCLFKVGNVCFGQPFFVKPMTYEQCKNEKVKLGIKNCYTSDDIWVAAVKVCGGVKYLPTPKDLEILANDLYGGNINEMPKMGQVIYSDAAGNVVQKAVGRTSAARNNSKCYLKYFRNLYPQTSFDNADEERKFYEISIEIPTNQETTEGNYVYSRYLGNSSTDLEKINRESSFFNSNFGLYHEPFFTCVTK